MNKEIKQPKDTDGQAMARLGRSQEMARQSLRRIKEMDLSPRQKEEVMKMIDQAKEQETKGNLSKAVIIYNELLKKLKNIKSKVEKGKKNLIFKTMEELEAVYSPKQIAHNQKQVNNDTKVYIGELYSEIFNELPKDVEHIYSSFPEGRIMQKEITIGGKTAKELANEIKEKGDKIDRYTEKNLLGNKDFKPLEKAEKLDLVILSIKDLGFLNGATTRGIYEKAQELGLKLVPAEVGPQLRLQYEDQPMGEWLSIGMEPLTVSSGRLDVFGVYRHGDGRWLRSLDGSPGNHWDSDDRWVFARPSSPEASTD